MLRYFISDLHLSDKRLDLIQAFIHLVDEISSCPTPCELYILGDFFEAYIGDDFQPEWIQRLDDQFQRLNDASIATYFIPGNRDFLVGESWLQRNHIVLLPEQFTLTLGHQKIVLTHGDEFCVDDHAYQTFRAMVRQPEWQQQVLGMPLEQRILLAQKLRDDSKTMSADKSDTIMDVNLTSISDSLSKKTALLIHGHTHRPALHINEPINRLVLGDWDQDIWVAIMDEQGINQYRIELGRYLVAPSASETWGVMHSLAW